MSTDAIMFKERAIPAKPVAPVTATTAATAAEANGGAVRCRLMTMDMGEGSREEGFRLNGSR